MDYTPVEILSRYTDAGSAIVLAPDLPKALEAASGDDIKRWISAYMNDERRDAARRVNVVLALTEFFAWRC